jgi:proteasome accessory factor C
MVDTAATRALRTMDLIPYILENPGISIRELAKQFDVTEKQIESDLQLVFMCGLPGYTPYELIDLVFEDGVVSIIDPQVLNRPRRFAKSELVMITLGLQILMELNQSNQDRLNKLSALANKIIKLGSSNSVLFSPTGNKSPFLEIITQGIAQGKRIHLTYHSLIKDQVSEREVLPHNLYFMNGNLYLSALDLSLNSDRVFKVELIKKCTLGEIASSNAIDGESSAVEVVLHVRKSHRNFIERNSSIITAIEGMSDYFVVHIQMSNLEWLKRSILSNAPGIKVVSPTILVGEVRQLATSLLASYQAVKAI